MKNIGLLILLTLIFGCKNSSENLTTLKGNKLLIDLETGAIDFMADDNQNNRIKGVLMQSEKKDE